MNKETSRELKLKVSVDRMELVETIRLVDILIDKLHECEALLQGVKGEAHAER